MSFVAAVALYLGLLWLVARVAEKYTALVGIGGLIGLLLAASLLP